MENFVAVNHETCAQATAEGKNDPIHNSLPIQVIEPVSCGHMLCAHLWAARSDRQKTTRTVRQGERQTYKLYLTHWVPSDPSSGINSNIILHKP